MSDNTNSLLQEILKQMQQQNEAMNKLQQENDFLKKSFDSIQNNHKQAQEQVIKPDVTISEKEYNKLKERQTITNYFGGYDSATTKSSDDELDPWVVSNNVSGSNSSIPWKAIAGLAVAAFVTNEILNKFKPVSITDIFEDRPIDYSGR